ncbi:MAG TPA: prepilin-type N-terminal cleavage/methylation domain-containing protein [Gammaproteobacteria bacterium]
MKKQTGFTLVELMIVVAILGVLTSVGILAYEGFVSKAERDRGCVMVMPEMARDLELHKQAYGVYTTDFDELNRVARSSQEWAATPADDSLQHTFAIAAGSSGNISTSFTITCTPTKVDGSGFDGSGCGALTYDNFGRKGGTADTANGKTVDSCWR